MPAFSDYPPSAIRYPLLQGSTTVQVRDFQPDRLRMKAAFSAESAEGWVTPEGLTGSVRLENLFGTPAANRRITAQLTLNPSIPSFRAFPDYQFHDPQYAREGYTEQLAGTTTDAQGDATLALNLLRFAKATYRMHLVAHGFEADGGRGLERVDVCSASGDLPNAECPQTASTWYIPGISPMRAVQRSNISTR